MALQKDLRRPSPLIAQQGEEFPFRVELGGSAELGQYLARRRRLFTTGRCGVGQRFSHVYSRPTQPLQDSQRDRRNERPDHITEFVCEDCGDHVHVFGHYYGLPVHSTCPLHPRTSDMPEHIIKGHLRGDT